jgi:hypothetical protein
MSYTTSREVWLALERTFSSISRAKDVQIRTQLANVRKGALSANEYFLSIKCLADELALAGQPLTADDIITYVLARLGQEYDSLASIITSRSDSVTLEELYSLLLISESRINHNNQPLQATPLVNEATKHPLHHPSSSFPIHANFHNPNRGTDFYRGRGRRSHFNSRNHGSSTSVTCQVCFKPGHSAKQCYHRFDLSYQDQRNSRNQPQAIVATCYHTVDNEWHPDSGATHHLNNNANNIHLLNEDDNSHDHI